MLVESQVEQRKLNQFDVGLNLLMTNVDSLITKREKQKTFTSKPDCTFTNPWPGDRDFGDGIFINPITLPKKKKQQTLQPRPRVITKLLVMCGACLSWEAMLEVTKGVPEIVTCKKCGTVLQWDGKNAPPKPIPQPKTDEQKVEDLLAGI